MKLHFLSLFGLAVATLVCGLISHASAQEKPAATSSVGATLTWLRSEGAESCPSEALVRNEVIEHVGRNPFIGIPTQSIEITVERKQGKWNAVILEKRGGVVYSRRILDDAANCTPIKDATVIVIALLINASTTSQAEPTVLVQPSSQPVSPSAPAPRFAQKPSPPSVQTARTKRTSPSQPRSIQTTITARGVGSFGLLSTAASGAWLAAEAGKGLFAASGGVLWLPTTRAGDGFYALGLTAGRLGACVHPFQKHGLSFDVCGGIWAGLLHLNDLWKQRETARPAVEDRPWTAAALTPILRVSVLSPLIVEIGTDFILSVIRNAFVRRDTYYIGSALSHAVEIRVFTQPWIAGSPFVGVGVSIP